LLSQAPKSKIKEKIKNRFFMSFLSLKKEEITETSSFKNLISSD